MQAALRLLLLSIGASSASLIFDGLIVQALVAATLAAAVAAVALAVPPGEAGYLRSIFRPIALVLAVPAIWMLIQVLPLKFAGLAHPIWDSAAAALGRPIGGSISVDPGTTLVSLCGYLSAAASMFAAAAVAIDRQRAKWLLFTLTGVTSLIAIVAIIHPFAGFALSHRLDGVRASGAARSCVAMGAIFSAATAIRAFDIYERGRGSGDAFGVKDFAALIAPLTAFAACTIALALNATGQLVFAAGWGLAALAALVAIRRLGLGPWGYSAIAATALITAVSIVAPQFELRTAELTLAFATHAPRPLVSITQRILADGTWTGTGAGTFAALVPIYRDADDLIADAVAPTVAAAVTVEMGRPMLAAAVIAIIAGIFVLLRGAVRRGRDSFHPAAGAGCLVVLLLLSFCEAGLFNTAVSTIAAAVVGLAFAQGQSRASR